jgi:LAO/AO transport system kinase
MTKPAWAGAAEVPGGEGADGPAFAPDRRLLARWLTAVEERTPGARELTARLYPRGGRARVIGVTGSPGVGKSTLVSALIYELRRRERSVAVLAVDPSSPFSGGAVLGDRVRMQQHESDDGVYIRSMSSRGMLGGLASAVPDAILILDASGFEYVIVETVGVGQSEVDIAGAADTTVVVLAPGMGDAVQAVKAGILEVADLFVINKADHAGAGQLQSQLQSGLATAPAGSAGPHWLPPILRAVAVRREGVAMVIDALDEHASYLRTSGERERRQRERALSRLREVVMAHVQEALSRFEQENPGEIDFLADAMTRRLLDPREAGQKVVSSLTADARLTR